jgi:hypothetical protein
MAICPPTGMSRLPQPGTLAVDEDAATIETSADGESWSFYAQPDPAASGEGGWLTANLGDGDTSAEASALTGLVNARYVRVVFVGDATGAPLGGLVEVEVWGPDAVE